MKDGFRMPFHSYRQFDTATLDIMRQAYDAVVTRRNLASTDPRTGKLAATIAELVAAGVTDLEKLTEQAASALRRL